eukprot:PhF_6_TR26535/c0_g1_i1/m.38359/K13303/SGK2; serum/glucocorticoid-regulated kinase 2
MSSVAIVLGVLLGIIVLSVSLIWIWKYMQRNNHTENDPTELEPVGQGVDIFEDTPVVTVNQNHSTVSVDIPTPKNENTTAIPLPQQAETTRTTTNGTTPAVPAPVPKFPPKKDVGPKAGGSLVLPDVPMELSPSGSPESSPKGNDLKPHIPAPNIQPRENEDTQRLTTMKSLFKKKAERAERKIGKQDFEIIRQLGKGAFAKVYLVRRKCDGVPYAMKVVQKSNVIHNTELIQTVFTERNVMKRSTHPFLIKLRYTFQSRQELFFILDFMQGGDMNHYLDTIPGHRFEYETARFYAAEILLGLQYLHENKCMYRDLKPENILLSASGHAVLADFGLSHESNSTSEMKTRGRVGSPYYVAPEILRDEQYTEAVDYWSYGVFLYKMLTGSVPFNGLTADALFQAIQHNNIQFKVNLPAAAKDLIQKLLNKDQRKRITRDTRDHPFFAGIDFDKVYNRTFRTPVPQWTPPTPLDLTPSPEFRSSSADDPSATMNNGSLVAPPPGFTTNPFDGFSFVDEALVGEASFRRPSIYIKAPPVPPSQTCLET